MKQYAMKENPSIKRNEIETKEMTNYKRRIKIVAQDIPKNQKTSSNEKEETPNLNLKR